MKKAMLYTAGVAAIFVGGAAAGAGVTGRILLPLISEEKVADKVIMGWEKSRYKIERKLFGEKAANASHRVSYRRYLAEK